MRRTKTIVLSASLLWLVMGGKQGLAQSPPPEAATTTESTPKAESTAVSPEDIARAQSLGSMYDFFFQHLETMDTMADEMDKKRQDTARWRSFEQDGSKLTPEEWSYFQAKARAYRKALHPLRASLIAALDLRDENRKQGVSNTAVLAKIADLNTQSATLLTTTLSDLNSHLGQETFHKLSTYIQSRLKTVVIDAPPTPPAIIYLPGDPHAGGKQ